MFKLILDLLFPPTCLSCAKFNFPICPDCLNKLQKTDSLICPICLEKSPLGLKHSKCQGDIDGLIFVFKYNKILQKIIKQIKYSFYFSPFNLFLKFCFKNLNKNKEFESFLKTRPIIIPVPIHKNRLKTRGFNQSYLIAKHFAKIWNLPLSTKIIFRKKDTIYQSTLKKSQRAKNMKNAFSPTCQILKLGKSPLKDKNILLVDDVFTTGITVKNCAKVIKILGANKIWVITIAHGK